VSKKTARRMKVLNDGGNIKRQVELTSVFREIGQMTDKNTWICKKGGWQTVGKRKSSMLSPEILSAPNDLFGKYFQSCYKH